MSEPKAKSSSKPTESKPKNRPPKDLQKDLKKIKQKNKDLLISLANLESQNVILKLENQKNINEFQAKAKDFQKIAQAEVNKITHNLRQKFEEDLQEAKKYGAQNLLESIAKPIININQAIKTGSSQENDQVKAYVQGFKMLMQQLMDELDNYGVKQIIPEIGQEFNPEIHQALETVSGAQTNQIVAIKQPGFKLYDRVIRPAIVVIGK